ncbi:MAG TPA: hypothetical protein VH309_11600, partial [Elusimicrobiota bacterium]|nr:hypothetical protein [Elusimicrobiota bacterium]
MSRAAALLATALALPARASAAAPSAASSLASLREDYATALRWGRYWIAVDDADRLDAVPGLPPTERAGLLVDGARARFLIGDAAGAERDLRRALALEPGGAEASYRLAALLRDRPDEALPYAERAARAAAAAPRRAAAERLAGEIRLDLGDEAGARSSLR